MEQPASGAVPGPGDSGIGPPPARGSSLEDVARYYTSPEAKRAGWECRMIPIKGKSPALNGAGWFSKATGDFDELMRVIGEAGFGVADGLGALMDRFVAFDVDTPSEVPPAMLELLQRGLRNETRPGRTHYVFALPPGVSKGSSKALLNARFGGSGGWGEVRCWNAQIRIWSPNSDGTMVALTPARVPPIPVELLTALEEPFSSGEVAATRGEMEDWLAEQTGTRREESWLDDDCRGKLRLRIESGEAKYEAVRGTVYHVAINVAAGCYPGWTAYELVLETYRAACEADSDWDTDRLRKYDQLWRGMVGNIMREGPAAAKVEEKVHELDAADAESEPSEAAKEWAAGLGIRTPTTSASPLADSLPRSSEPSRPDQIRQMIEAVESSHEDRESTRQDVEAAVVQPTEADRELLDRTSRREEPVVEAEPEVTVEPEPFDWPKFKQGRLDQTDANGKKVGVKAVTARLNQLADDEIAREERRKLVRASVVIEPSELAPEWPTFRPPTILKRDDGAGLLYPGLVHAVFGRAGSGKTTLMAHAAAERLREGGRVMWVDYEMGARRFQALMMRMRLPASEFGSGRLVHMDFTSRGGDVEGAVEWVAGRGWGLGDLVVVDSTLWALTELGIERAENSSEAFAQLVGVISPLREMEVATSLIDHTGKGEQTDARGSSAKADQVDVAYLVEATSAWTIHVDGTATVECRKDREGFYRRDDQVAVVRFLPDMAVAADRRPTVVEVLDPHTPAAAAWAVGASMGLEDTVDEEVLEAVERLQSSGAGTATKDVKAAVKRRAEMVSESLARLVREGALEVTAGPSRAQIYSVPSVPEQSGTDD